MVLETPSGLAEFKQRCEPRQPSIPSTAQMNESLQLDHLTGLRLLEYAPAKDVYRGSPPKSRRERGRHRYLSVIDDEGIPFIREIPIVALGIELPKHTNLTGGGPAYAGGELWFDTEESLFVSGGSGRCEPIDAEQLEGAAGVFESYGYAVSSLGWDSSRNKPRRFLWA